MYKKEYKWSVSERMKYRSHRNRRKKDVKRAKTIRKI